MYAMSLDIENVLMNGLIHPMSMEENCYNVEQFFFLYCWEEAKRARICKTPQRTSMLRGHLYVYLLLCGAHLGNYYSVFHLRQENICILCNTFREGNYIEESRGVSMAEALFIFFYIVCQKLGMRVAADHFQHSLKTISRHFQKDDAAVMPIGEKVVGANF